MAVAWTSFLTAFMRVVLQSNLSRRWFIKCRTRFHLSGIKSVAHRWEHSGQNAAEYWTSPSDTCQCRSYTRLLLDRKLFWQSSPVPVEIFRRWQESFLPKFRTVTRRWVMFTTSMCSTISSTRASHSCACLMKVLREESRLRSWKISKRTGANTTLQWNAQLCRFLWMRPSLRYCARSWYAYICKQLDRPRCQCLNLSASLFQ